MEAPTTRRAGAPRVRRPAALRWRWPRAEIAGGHRAPRRSRVCPPARRRPPSGRSHAAAWLHRAGASTTDWSRSRRATAARSSAMRRTFCAARTRSGTAPPPAPPRPWPPTGVPGSGARSPRGGRRSARRPRARPASGRSPPRPRESSSSSFSRSAGWVPRYYASVEPTPELMKAINAAFNSRDVDRIMSFFAEDCTFLMARGPEPEGRRVHGKAAVRKVLGDRFRVITDMRWDHIDSFITGNRAVTVWMVTGTGVDGETLNYRGCDLYEFRGDKVLNKDTYWKLVEHRDRL